MNYRINILLLSLIICSCISKKEEQKKDVISDNNQEENITHGTSYIIQAKELLDQIETPNIKIIDFRKKEKYIEEHITGAINISRNDIEDSNYSYEGMMADKGSIELLFSNLGIKNNDTLIVYDDKGSCDAARLWWVLQNYDFKSVKILDGGIQAWQNAGGIITNEIKTFPFSVFELPNTNSFKFLIEKDEMFKIITSKDKTVIIDTRTIDEYSGKRQKKGAFKAGRIPKSHLIDWSETIDYNGTMKFKTKKELKEIYGKLNIHYDDLIVTYCHTGVRSAHTTFVLTQILGYKNVKNYDGSWSEWSYFKEYPREKDSITTILN